MSAWWPQVLIVCIIGLELGYAFSIDGKQISGKNYFASELFRISIWVTLLYFGGFFSK